MSFCGKVGFAAERSDLNTEDRLGRLLDRSSNICEQDIQAGNRILTSLSSTTDAASVIDFIESNRESIAPLTVALLVTSMANFAMEGNSSGRAMMEALFGLINKKDPPLESFSLEGDRIKHSIKRMLNCREDITEIQIKDGYIALEKVLSAFDMFAYINVWHGTFPPAMVPLLVIRLVESLKNNDLEFAEKLETAFGSIVEQREVIAPSEKNGIVYNCFCWGAAGSSWLAYCLNSHKDVLSFHAPNLPRFDRHNQEDLKEMLDYITRNGVARYRISGFCHSIDLSKHQMLKDYAYARRLWFRGFILIRDPVKRIYSNFRLSISNEKSRINNEKIMNELRHGHRKLVELADRDFPDDFYSLGFYRSCSAASRIVSEVESGFPIYRIEDLTSKADILNDLFSYISDGSCSLPEGEIEEIQNTVVSSHVRKKLTSDQIYNSWGQDYKLAYHLLLGKESFELYQQLGYEFPHPMLFK